MNSIHSHSKNTPTNICIIGAKNTGKTTFIKSFFTKKPQKTYEPTIGYECGLISINTSKGPLKINLVEVCGDPVYKCNDYLEFYRKSMGCIVFMTKDTQEEGFKLMNEYHKHNPNKHIQGVWSKCDLLDEAEYASKSASPQISSYWKFNTHIPLENILRKVLGEGIKIQPEISNHV